MQLQMIKVEVCPWCNNCTIVAESCRNVHCNGQGFERREFACGCAVEWSPNFERLQVANECPKHPDRIARTAKRTKFVDEFWKLVNISDLDEEFKKKLKYLLLPINPA